MQLPLHPLHDMITTMFILFLSQHFCPNQMSNTLCSRTTRYIVAESAGSAVRSAWLKKIKSTENDCDYKVLCAEIPFHIFKTQGKLNF